MFSKNIVTTPVSYTIIKSADDLSAVCRSFPASFIRQFLPKIHFILIYEEVNFMRKTYDELEFTDDFMFSKILYSNPEICRELLELILDRKIRKVKPIVREKEVSIRPESHGVRFDVYAEDDENSAFDIEMQVKVKSSLPRRSRYYHAMLDLDQLRTGREYSELKESYVIFICKNKLDVAIDKPVYYYRNVCEGNPEITLNDGNYTVFVNACYEGDDVSDEMRDFLRYIRTGKISDGDDNLPRRINREVLTAKRSRRWEAELMTFEEYMQEEREEGRAEGRTEERTDVILKLSKIHTANEISDILEIPINEVIKIIGNVELS